MTSILSRRAIVAGAAALAIAPAYAQTGSLDFAAAAAYSANSRGVSFLAMQRGAILFEDYPNGAKRDDAHELASGTKSYCGIIAAAAAQDGMLSLDEMCADTLPEWRTDARKSKITIRHLLTLTSGVETERGGFGRAPPYADAIALPAVSEPGARFAYGPAPFQVFGEIMKRKLAARGLAPDPVAYLDARVLAPINASAARWRRGRDDNPLLPQGANLTARAWARFGQFVLDGGQDLDPAVMKAQFEPTRANPGYGLTWWLLRPGLKGPSRRAGVDGALGAALASEDVVMAGGAGNQRLYLLRKRGLVVVRQADRIGQALMGRGADWSDEDFLRALLG
jgi:CubicO group peptidase (beta-lactamase class C family)